MPNLGWVIGEIKNHVYGKRQRNLYHVTKFYVFLSFTVHYFCTKISRFSRVLSIRFVLGCFYLLIFYFEKFSTSIWRLPFAVKVTLHSLSSISSILPFPFLSVPSIPPPSILISSISRSDFSPGTLDFPFPQTQPFQYQIWSGKQEHFQRSGGELPCALRAKKLHLQCHFKETAQKNKRGLTCLSCLLTQLHNQKKFIKTLREE